MFNDDPCENAEDKMSDALVETFGCGCAAIVAILGAVGFVAWVIWRLA